MWANKVHQRDIIGMYLFGWIPRAERFFVDQDIIHIINVVGVHEHGGSYHALVSVLVPRGPRCRLGIIFNSCD